VEAYKKAVLAASEDEEKRWKAAEKFVKQDVLREKQQAATMTKPNMPQPVPMVPQNPMPGPPPPLMYDKPVGPCFQCGMLEHLKRHCPKLAGQHILFNITV